MITTTVKTSASITPDVTPTPATIKPTSPREIMAKSEAACRQLFRRAKGHNDLTLLNGQLTILARTAKGRPYFAVFIYGDGEAVNLIHVIAGRKLSAIG